MKTNLAALVLTALLTTCTACAPSVENLGALPTGLEVDAIPGATKSEYDVYDTTGKKVAEYRPAGVVLEIPAGHYTLTRSGLRGYLWGEVDVRPEQVTHVMLGAIHVITVEGAKHGNFSTWTPAGDKLVDRDDPDQLVSAPAGMFRITDELTPSFVWADSVIVQEGIAAEILMGAIRLHVPAGTSDQYFTVYDDTRTEKLKDELTLEVLETAPADNLVLTRYLDRAMDYAAVSVPAGGIADVSLGAILWNGSQVADLYDASGSQKLVESVHPGMQIAAASGNYVFKKNGVAISAVSVAEGEVTTAQ